jgi:outer membrane lipoprotein carrier protein
MKIKNIVTVMMASLAIFSKGYAQQDPKATVILNEMSKKFQAFKSFQADFTYSLETTAGKVKDSYQGQISVKGNKYFLKISGQEVYNDGTTVWTYMKDENECNVSEYVPDENEISPTKIHEMYKKGYKYTFLEEKKEAEKVFDVIDLIPEDKNKSFFKVRIMINKKDKSVKSWKIFDRNGNRYLYSINKFTPNSPVEDKQFKFDKSKYPKVQIVDLR